MDKRMMNKKKDVLKALKDAGDNGLTNQELSRIALRYGAYLGEMYKEGYEIPKTNLGNGLFRYIYKSSPKNKIVREKAIDKIINEIGKRGAVNKDEFVKILEEMNVSVKYKPNTYKAS